MSESEDEIMNAGAEIEEDDLFGDDDEQTVEKPRELSDEELDSGDDENRYDRVQKGEGLGEDQGEGHELRVQDTLIWRHPLPKPVDREFNTLRLPKFLGIDPHPYKPETFKLPESDHHLQEKSSNFSASVTAGSTMRYRKDPSGRLESNTNVYRWSDGSTTIAVGDQHYELQTKPLAPAPDKPYQEVMDSHSYIASPSIAAQVLVLFGHMTNQYTVRPNKDIEDDALDRLQKSLAAAARKGDEKAKNGPELIANTVDPELQKRRAEMAEKERMKAQRRRETAAEKASMPSGRGRSGGLTVDDLEGRSGRRAAGPGRKAAGVKRPKRRPEYDSDDDLPRGRGREDEYDKEDDFLASSDEDLDGAEGEDDEEEELLDDESERDEPKSKKQKTSRAEETSDADADAEADLDDDEALAVPVATEGPSGRGRKRNVIEDDDDDE
ncbi:Leo1-like protein-domain-containing protein [Tricladium varicosporioides]|nr:Leo1-like protein-domain-containing protein [Hymenoscyphus varicosporioides]